MNNDAAFSPQTSLFAEISQVDETFFAAYNRGDLAKVKELFTEDLEFYHDRGGLTDYGQSIDAFEQVFGRSARMRRELVEGTMEVFPIPGYGALAVGTHRFYMTEPGEAEKLSTTGKFMNVWKQVGAGWKIARAISYDH